MKKTAAHYGLLLCFSTSIVAAQQQSAPSSDVNTQTPKKLACLGQSSLISGDESSDKKSTQTEGENCEKTMLEGIERLTVQGEFIGLQVPEIEGRYVLDRNFISALPRTGGDITEMLVNLPGVELGEEFYDVEQQAEVGAQRVSISGAEAWQTGFFMDGVNFNSRQDPTEYNRSLNAVNDVVGGAQNFNVNQQIVESIEVYTNNVPANYGSFSGGVVEVETRDGSPTNPEFGFNYRTSRSDWNEYNTYIPEDYEGDESSISGAPIFEKQVINVNASTPIGEHHQVLVAISHTTSDISKTSLSRNELTSRETANYLLKFTQKDLGLDKLQLVLNYSPYVKKDLLRNVKDSDFEISGGGLSAQFKALHEFENVGVSTKLSYANSENSRSAPAHYYLWQKATGKDWGNGDGSSTTELSKQGGYGDLDKEQQTIFWEGDADFHEFNWLDADHQVNLGFQYSWEQLSRKRFYDTYSYNSPISNGVLDLNCSGHLLDCVEFEISQTEEEIEAYLGEPLDLTNNVHLAYYDSIVTQAPQYFAVRNVYRQEAIEVAVQNLSFYLTDSINRQDITVNLGLRYEYDDFLQNHNIAPRIAAGYDVFSDGDTLINFGINRYYDSNLLSYKVKEQQLPRLLQYRGLNSSSYLQNWEQSSGATDYRYKFVDIDTPYNDELVLGIKQATAGGTLSLEYVKRWREKQIVYSSDLKDYNEADGYYYRFANNGREGGNERVSISWQMQWQNHSLWANTSYQLSQWDSYEGESVEVTDVENMVFIRTGNSEDNYEYEEVSLSKIDVLESVFTQPFKINFGWTYSFGKGRQVTLTGNWVDSSERFENTNESRESEQVERLCPECQGNESILVDIYEKVKKPQRLLMNASLAWRSDWQYLSGVKFRLDIQNLLNARTYSLSKNTAGVEVGRAIWLGIGYQW